MTEKTNAGVSIDVRVGEEITLDADAVTGLRLGPIRVLVERKDGQRARLRIVADPRIMVRRPQPRIKVKAV
jgi:hypothetical protein